jgi:hypothetical protein
MHFLQESNRESSMSTRPQQARRQPSGFRLAAACAVWTSSLCLAFDWPQKTIDFELTGTVRDADTKEPLEGAYVIATYKIVRSGLAATATPCVKTKGMYTDKDGTYHFPVEKLDGRNPSSTNAIKPGYFLHGYARPDSSAWKNQSAAAYSGRDIYLKKQDPSKPDWRYHDGDVICHEAPTREAAAAGIQFLKIALTEEVRYGAPAQGLEATKGLIEIFERRPSEPATVK